MTTSPKRLGLDVKNDLELELRLRRIEAALERTLQSGDVGTTSDSTQRVTNIPQVTGLRVTGKTPGAITLAWNQVRISDLRRYELDIAKDLAFTSNKQTFNVAGTDFQYSTAEAGGGGGATDVYARVRARNRSGNVGPYSATLNTATGQAQTGDIADGSVTSDKIDTDEPIVFDGFDDEDVGSKLALYGYINGLTLSNNADDAAKDIDIAIGIARDSTNIASLLLTSVLTKQIDASWAAGNDQGGLASALALAANTWYHVFLVGNTSGNVDVGFDTDLSATNLLADTGGLSLYRRIGAVKTDATPDIRGFVQDRDYFEWKNPDLDHTETNTGTNSKLSSELAVPLGIATRVLLNVFAIDNVGGYMYFSDPAVDDEDPTIHADAAGPLSSMDVDPTGTRKASQIWCRTDTDGKIRMDFSDDINSLDISTIAYIDNRGKL